MAFLSAAEWRGHASSGRVVSLTQWGEEREREREASGRRFWVCHIGLPPSLRVGPTGEPTYGLVWRLYLGDAASERRALKRPQSRARAKQRRTDKVLE